MTHAKLLELIYRFYPRGMYTTSPGYDDTAERRRQVDAQHVAVAEYPKWEAMLDRLRARFEVQDLSLHVLSGSFDSAYSGYIKLPDLEHPAIGFHVSILGPYYAIHPVGFPGEEPHVQQLAQEIEATYGYEPVPPEIGKVVVPDVSMDTRGLGETTVSNCLLSVHWGDGLPSWM